MLARLRLFILKRLSAEHRGLDAFLNAEDVSKVQDIFDFIFKDFETGEDARQHLEAAYQFAHRRGVKLSGWHLRFVLYWMLGKRERLWD